ncbi:translesion DNA synthesis-associated protein ImuA [Variovorax sp. RHLX14]|uniref:translesion DNA synthesis-associated protein ImuA n=1 Tax=Variovorax sp. RHLX14 TaxID=1259731 RepID=UPI003F448D1F
MSLPLTSSSYPSFASARHNVWRGDELGSADAQVMTTGHSALDVELPGGGWPVGALTEILLGAPDAHVWQLLLPVLARAAGARKGPVVLIGAPHEPFGPALAAGGLPSESLMWVGGGSPDRGGRTGSTGSTSQSHMWACEQALRCADVAAVMAWLPQARVGELRRLQLAAAQHEGLLFVFRPESVALSASPARLRIRLVSAEGGQMDVHLLKRRGPPLAQPLTLPARSERIVALLAASQMRRKRRRQQQGETVDSSDAAHIATVVRLDLRKPKQGEVHAVDRLAVAA